MTTIVMQADLMHESGNPESVPYAVKFGETTRAKFVVDDDGLCIVIRDGHPDWGNGITNWDGPEKEVRFGDHGQFSKTVLTRLVLIPLAEMLSGDKVVSVTTTNGGSWVLSGNKYTSVSGGADGFAFPEVSVSDGFGHTNSERENELENGYQRG